jgi:NADPH2:quinone reductase
VAITRPGGPEVIDLVEREVREPAAGEVRIRVVAAAVNPTDISLRERGDDTVPPPWIPGMDAAGVIEGVGAGVAGRTLGEQVMAAVTPRRSDGGAQAELLVAPAASVAPVPDGASLHQAATLPMNGLTALLALELLGLGPGQWLAVTGGAGLLASYTIAIAAERGLHVVADAKPEDTTLVQSFGATIVLPRGEDFPEKVREVVPGGADGLVDTALLGRTAFPALRNDAGMAVVRGWDGSPTERGIIIRPVAVRTVLDRSDWLDSLRGLASGGVLKLRVAGEYPPERAADAQRAMGAGGLRGRALVVF